MPLLVNGVQVDITATNSASPVLKQVAADIGGLETSAANAGQGVSGVSDEMAGMVVTAQGLGQALSIVTAGAAAFVAVFEFGEIASGNERLATSGELLASSYGESLDNIVAKVSAASRGTVANMDIISSANKAMMLGVGGNAEQLANLMEIAAFRGRAMGLETSQAFDDMARGIGRMSPMILDNLGIVVDAESTYSAYATSVGKTSGELSRSEKVQALLNKVLEEGNKQLADAGGLVADNATEYERWNAQLKNTKNSLLENTIGMSHLAGMGATMLESFTNVTDDQNILEFWANNATGANVLNTALGFLEERVRLEGEALAGNRNQHWEAMASYYDTATAVNELTGAQVELAEVDAAAVKGAMEVHDTYEKLGDKMSDLQADHDELLAKKQGLIDQGYWPEHSAVQSLNEKLAENEQKQKDVTLAMQGALTQMLLNTAAAGLDAEGQLALARATGQIDEATYAALDAQTMLKKQYEDGLLSAEGYARKTLELRDAVARLESKKITITADAIYNEIRNVMHGIGNIGGGSDGNPGTPWATGTPGWMEVPAGYPNDTYPIRLTSGERFAVIPAGVSAAPASSMGGGFGGGGSTFVYAPQIGVSFGDEAEAKSRLYPWFLDMLEQAKAGGHV